MKKIAALFLFYTFTSCIKDKPLEETTTTSVSDTQEKRVYVVCEGNYGSSNATVSLYLPTKGEVVENYYLQQNGISPGDVAQSLTKIDGLWYLVMNNSGQVVICDSNFKKIGAITGLKSPRYIAKVGVDKLYITDLYDNGITIASIQQRSVIGKIKLKGWTEQLIQSQNRVFIGAPTTNYVYVVNSDNDQLTDSIPVGENLRAIALNKYNQLITLSYNSLHFQKLKFTNTTNLQTEYEHEEKTNDSFSGLALNMGGDTLYFIGKGVYRMNIDHRVLETVYSNSTSNYYGLGISPENTIYLADAHDYSQRSTITVLKSNGTVVSTFKVGVNANSFVFEH